MNTDEGYRAKAYRRPFRVWLRRRGRKAAQLVRRLTFGLPPGARYVTCGRGHRHYGAFGACGLLIVSSGHVLLGRRSGLVSHPGFWGIPGGGRDHAGEAWGTAAYREAAEETGIDLSRLRLVRCSTADHGGWQYRTFVVFYDGVVHNGPALPDLRPCDPETDELRWVPIARVADLPLHGGFARFWSTVSTDDLHDLRG